MINEKYIRFLKCLERVAKSYLLCRPTARMVFKMTQNQKFFQTFNLKAESIAFFEAVLVPLYNQLYLSSHDINFT